MEAKNLLAKKNIFFHGVSFFVVALILAFLVAS
jgi:hypothetical protein